MSDVLLKVGEAAKQLRIGKHAVPRIVPQVVLGPRTIRYRQSDVTAIISGNTFSRQLVVGWWPHTDQKGNKTGDPRYTNHPFGNKK